MAVISECLILLLLCQALGVFAEEEEADYLVRDQDLQPEVKENLFASLIAKRRVCKKPPAQQGRSEQDLNKDYVKWHNYYRCLHGVGPLNFDKELRKLAKANVQMNIKSGGMTHSTDKTYGENLWAMWGSGGYGLKYVTGQDPVKQWYDEMTNPGYNFDSPTMFTFGTGHFTQLVWKDTKKIGCYTAEHPYQGKTRVFVACEYYPPGNANIYGSSENINNWKEQVPRPKY